MKNLFLGALLLLSTLSFSQSKTSTKSGVKNVIKSSVINDLITTDLENGLNVKVLATLEIKKNVIDTISNSLVYKKWKESLTPEVSINLDKEYGKIPLVEQYIKTEVMMANMFFKFKFKNQNSYSVTPNSKGSIYLDTSGNLIIFLHTQGQNGYGNTLLNENYFKHNLTTGEQKAL